jgi:hypothetical protein
MSTFDKKEYNKVYYQQNKDKHLEYISEKVECNICNVSISRGNMHIHKKTKKHLKKQKILEEEIEFENKKNTIENAKTMLDKLYIMDNSGNMNKLSDLLPKS